MSDNVILNLGADANVEPSFVKRATDPVLFPATYASPADFGAQYPTPLDTTEIVAMCEEISLLQFLPRESTMLKQHTWRELNELAFTSGSAYISFSDGECPTEYTHNGDNTTIDLKNIGAKKTLSLSDIRHSQGVAGANWNGINALLGAMNAGEGVPGNIDASTFQKQFVAGVKEKELTLAMTLVMNGWDRLLVEGNSTNNSLEFTGIESWQDVNSVTFHTNDTSVTGTFSADAYDRFLVEGCAKPDTIMGHPQAIQGMMSAYFQLGYQGSQVVNFSDGNRITPGFNFGGSVNTGIGTVRVVADNNFDRVTVGSTVRMDLWAMRMTHNGDPLVYVIEQFPLSMNDLAPGCTAVAFQVWAKNALIIKHACAHARYRTWFTGRVATTCTVIG